MNMFCTTATRLIEYLRSIYPDDADLRKVQSGLDLMIRNNKPLLINMFYQHARQFREQILAHDYAFFRENATTLVETHVDEAVRSEVDYQTLIDQVKQKYDNADATQQAEVWKSLEVMMRTSERYCGAV